MRPFSLLARAACAALATATSCVMANPTAPANATAAAALDTAAAEAATTKAKATCTNGDGSLVFVQAHKSKRSRWCVDPSVWADHAADFKKFYHFGDSVVTNLETLFAFKPDGLPFTYEPSVPNGGAHTGSDFGLGDTVTGDAFWNTYSYRDASGKNVDVPGFWGYLLTLHEAINVWTGEVTSNWPTDWWADHRSPFPNSMDYHVMQTIGQAQNDSVLLAAADAQHRRFNVPGASEFDSEVAMFDSFYDRFGGFKPFSRLFKLIQADQMNWANVAPNPSPLLSEYVIAYLQLALKTPDDLTKSDFVAAGVGTKDTSIAPYTVSTQVVKAIADAHCSIAGARTDPAVSSSALDAALANLRRGNYAQASLSSRACSQAPAGQGPRECGCAANGAWTALWNAAQ